MRSLAKRMAELVAVHSGMAWARRSLGAPKVLVLAYHNVVPDEDPARGDASLHLPISELRAQLDLLQCHFDVISWEEAGSPRPSGARPAVALTFDDAYRGLLELGVEEVVSRGLPLLVFIPPGLLGTSGFWWDLLSDPGLGGVEPEVRKYALSSLGGGQEKILHWAASVGRAVQEVPELYQPASEEEVMNVGNVEGVALGSHTWSHVNLTAVPPETAAVEMAKPLEWLSSIPSGRKLISYPYGAWDPSLDGVVREAGYRAGFLVQGGITNLRRVRSKPFAIPRINVPRGLSPEGFLARVSGVWT